MCGLGDGKGQYRKSTWNQWNYCTVCSHHQTRDFSSVRYKLVTFVLLGAFGLCELWCHRYTDHCSTIAFPLWPGSYALFLLLTWSLSPVPLLADLLIENVVNNSFMVANFTGKKLCTFTSWLVDKYLQTSQEGEGWNMWANLVWKVYSYLYLYLKLQFPVLHLCCVSCW